MAELYQGDLEVRPIFVRTPAHIEAHLIVCLIALVILRIIQHKLVASGVGQSDKAMLWTSGLSGERIQLALRKWQVDALPDSLFRFNNLDDPDLKAILDAFDITIPTMLYTPGALKKISTSIQPFGS